MSDTPRTDELRAKQPSYTEMAEHAEALERELAEMEARKDGAYEERNQVVAALATMALGAGWCAGTARTAIEGWSDDWHGCVYIDLPTGQVSWHFHDSHAHLFASLPTYMGEWDGHDTPEKYRRVAALSTPPARDTAERPRLVNPCSRCGLLRYPSCPTEGCPLKTPQSAGPSVSDAEAHGFDRESYEEIMDSGERAMKQGNAGVPSEGQREGDGT